MAINKKHQEMQLWKVKREIELIKDLTDDQGEEFNWYDLSHDSYYWDDYKLDLKQKIEIIEIAGPFGGPVFKIYPSHEDITKLM